MTRASPSSMQCMPAARMCKSSCLCSSQKLCGETGTPYLSAAFVWHVQKRCCCSSSWYLNVLTSLEALAVLFETDVANVGKAGLIWLCCIKYCMQRAIYYSDDCQTKLFISFVAVDLLSLTGQPRNSWLTPVRGTMPENLGYYNKSELGFAMTCHCDLQICDGFDWPAPGSDG